MWVRKGVNLRELQRPSPTPLKARKKRGVRLLETKYRVGELLSKRPQVVGPSSGHDGSASQTLSRLSAQAQGLMRPNEVIKASE